MHIVLVTPECAPVVKVGGLGDFIQGIAKELQVRGHTVELILPKYDTLRYDLMPNFHKIEEEIWSPCYEEHIKCEIYAGSVEGLHCFFIDPHSPHQFFARGAVYGQPDDAERFAFFSRAVLEFLANTGRQPDILHCHDWQTGLVPVLLYEAFQNTQLSHSRVCFTLHNLGHQGVTGDYVLRLVGLEPAALMTPERLNHHDNAGGVSLLKGGIVYANFVTTVSPHYAWEIQHTELGMGLQTTLLTHSDKFGGVLNGLDYSVWNPATDALLAHPFSAETVEEKQRNTQALRERLGLQETHKPIVSVVSRLDWQKGVDLMIYALRFALNNNAQFVLLGATMDEETEQKFTALQSEFATSPDCRLVLEHNEELAHLIYAGADMIVIPSRYEPCGLTQMIAMRYGTIPIVRKTGGLADTVFDANYSEHPFEQRNGYTFDDLTHDGIESGLRRAIGLWHEYPEYFRQLRLNAMNCDHSWSSSGQHYLNVYEHILTMR